MDNSSFSREEIVSLNDESINDHNEKGKNHRRLLLRSKRSSRSPTPARRRSPTRGPPSPSSSYTSTASSASKQTHPIHRIRSGEFSTHSSTHSFLDLEPHADENEYLDKNEFTGPPSATTSAAAASNRRFHSFLALAGMIVFLAGCRLLANWNNYLFIKHPPTTLHSSTAKNSNTIFHKNSSNNSIVHNHADSNSDLQHHFCTKPQIRHNNVTAKLLYQCSGTSYDQFATKLYELVGKTSSRNDSKFTLWGRREYPLPNNTSILVLGNSHLRQVSKTLVCQYANQIQDFSQTSAEMFTIRFQNNSTWISITNTVLVYSQEWNSLVETFFLRHKNLTFRSMDALIFGKFTLYQEALHTNYEYTMQEEQHNYEQGIGEDYTTSNDNTTNATFTDISFSTISPPQLVDAARVFANPIVAISMFATTDIPRAQAAQKAYHQAFPNRTNVKFVNSRKYIEQLGLECGSDDKQTMGTCHEPGDIILNSNRSPADMHRCAGSHGGHADLIAWDLIEKLHNAIG